MSADNYLAAADVWTILDLIAAEFQSDPTSVQCFDQRIVARAIELATFARDGKIHRLTLTPSHVMALRSILLDYIRQPHHTEIFHDIVRQTETTPEEILLVLMRM